MMIAYAGAGVKVHSTVAAAAGNIIVDRTTLAA
jgi:hypothetical protein